MSNLHSLRSASGLLLRMAVFAASVSPCVAELSPLQRLCVDRGIVAEERIAACTALIRSGEGNPHNVAVSLLNRGAAYGLRGDHDLALADFDNAIQLDPGFAAAYNLRSIAWRNKGDLDRAIADAGTAIRLNPSFGPAWASRGAAYGKKG
ncbi:MAG: tetratricopeptide repeat protein, partial [Hyphomicrobiales bacterium]